VPPPDAPEVRYRAVLELEPGPVTLETVRRHYLRLVAAYHPDRVAGLGVKLRRLAEEETKAINEAYAFFKRHLHASGG
jgi:curved DNA-binding protein CbpA